MREKIREAYIAGVDINDICQMHHIARSTFYYHKKADLKAGINWDYLLLNARRDVDSIKDKEAVFLSTLISSFEKFIEESKSDELSPSTLEKLHQYAQTYWRLKAPKNDEFSLKNKLMQTAKETINEIAKIALEENNTIVVEFLGQNAEKIINKVFKEQR
ncbi:DUF1804 family protein [Helicobacter sp. MIT 21-1697]|uniref:DUF1804 family protein n=1 Tax=Helicobacter sp. MIT 21-1697 TaxID=2993733 RepID=UPI00224A5A4B|nr:DUF1804 family protein [Helicobacter sp. MIT 21-1697]MCX2717808.1 DUF1804 family protein [Helicobacter sp. MIT 21-1697]